MVANSQKQYVIDTYAILAYYFEEKGAGEIEELVRSADSGDVEVYLNEINLGEVYYKTWKYKGKDAATEVLAGCISLPFKLIGVDREFILAAAEIKAQNRLSYADAFCIATAKETSAPIITGDPEFGPVEGVEIRWIGED